MKNRAVLLGIGLSVLLPQHLEASEPTVTLHRARELSHKQGDHARVIELLEREILGAPEAVPPSVRIQALELVGVSYELMDENARAADTFTRLWLELVAMEGSDAHRAVQESARVANVLTRASRFEDSRSFWNIYLSAGERSELVGDIERADAFCGIARSYAGEGDQKRAVLWFRKALGRISAPTMQRAVILFQYADSLASAGRKDEADALRREAREIRAEWIPEQ